MAASCQPDIGSHTARFAENRGVIAAIPRLVDDSHEIATQPSAHFPKFVLYRGTHFHELRKIMGTGKPIDSSAAFYLKFLDRIRRLCCRNFK